MIAGLLFQDELDKMAAEQAKAFGTGRWIANLGHGIYPDVDPDHLGAYIEAVRKHSKKP